MLLVGNKRTELMLYLSSKGFAVLKGPVVIHTHLGEGASENVDAFQTWLRTTSMLPSIKVFLSASICRPFMANVPYGLTHEEAERAWHAAAMLRTGVTSDCKIWRDETAAAGNQIGAAVEKSLLSQLMHVTKSERQRLRISTIQPAWSDWLRATLVADKSTSCLVLHETDSVTVLSGQDGQFELATTVLVNNDVMATQATLDRLLLISNPSGGHARQARLQLRSVKNSVAITSDLRPLLEAAE